MDGLDLFFGVAGVIGTVFSVLGALKSMNASKKAKEYLKDIEDKKSALDLGTLKVRLDNLHKDIYNLMISKRNLRGAGKEIDKYRDWYKDINQILMEIPTEMNDITQGLEEVKNIMNSHILEEKSLHDSIIDKDTSFQKAESIIYGITKLIKYYIDGLGEK